jgi:SpoVK/Ycf46/Vps4 family AAA+-type ATPase
MVKGCVIIIIMSHVSIFDEKYKLFNKKNQVFINYLYIRKIKISKKKTKFQKHLLMYKPKGKGKKLLDSSFI